jgi:hypothetical protein
MLHTHGVGDGNFESGNLGSEAVLSC